MYKISKNILYNFSGQVTLLILTIVTAPFIINSLGHDKYGIFTLAITVVGYFSILDLGLGTSIIKFISDSHSRQDKESLEKIINTSLTSYTVIGFLGAVLIILSTQFIVRGALHIPLTLIPLALSVFYISSLGFFVNMILTVFNSIPIALERMDITNSRNIIFGLLNTLGIVILLILGQDLLTVIIWSILVSVVATVSFLKIIFDLLPNIKIKFGFDKEIFVRLIKFGLFKSIVNISGQIVFQLDRLLIGIFLPIASVTFYTVPAILAQRGFSILFNVTSAFFPAISFSQAKDDKQRVKDLYLRMTKIIILLISPLMAIIFLLAEDILEIWLGSQFAYQSTSTLKILTLAYFLAAFSAPGVIVSDASNKPQIPAIFSIFSAAINLIAALILIPVLGIEGAAWALVINFAVQVPVFLMIVHKKVLGISHLTVIAQSIIKPLLSGITTAVILYTALNFIDSPIQRLVAIPILFGLLYIVINYLIGTFDERDKLMVLFFINRFKLIFQRK